MRCERMTEQTFEEMRAITLERMDFAYVFNDYLEVIRKESEKFDRTSLRHDGLTTLRDIVTEHPEWMDYPIAVPKEREEGYDFIGCAGMVFVMEPEEEFTEMDGVPLPVLVFVPN